MGKRVCSRVLAAAVIGAALLVASGAGATGYVLTTSAPKDMVRSAYLDTLITTTDSSIDTLMFGFTADGACVWTIDSDSVGVRFVGPPTVLSQIGGSAPPDSADERQKARYGAKAFSAIADTIQATNGITKCTPTVPNLFWGVIVTGVEATVVHIQAWCF